MKALTFTVAACLVLVATIADAESALPSKTASDAPPCTQEALLDAQTQGAVREIELKCDGQLAAEAWKKLHLLPLPTPGIRVNLPLADPRDSAKETRQAANTFHNPGEGVLLPMARTKLDEFLAQLQAGQGRLKLIIVMGIERKDEVDLGVGALRARTVKAYLVAAGVPESRIYVEHKVVPDPDEASHHLRDCRTEILALLSPPAPGERIGAASAAERVSASASGVKAAVRGGMQAIAGQLEAAARQTIADHADHPISGTSVVHFEIDARGALVSSQSRSSSSPAAKAAALDTVKLAAPFAPFSEALRQRTDLLALDWKFTFFVDFNGANQVTLDQMFLEPIEH